MNGRSLSRSLRCLSPNPHPLADLSSMSSPRSTGPSPDGPPSEPNIGRSLEMRQGMVDRYTQTDLSSVDIDRLFTMIAERTETPSADAPTRREPVGESSRHHTAGTPCQQSRRSSVSVQNGKEHLYLIGGTANVFARMIEEYIPDTQTWQEVVSIPSGVEWMTPAVATRHTSVYVIGEADFQRRNRIGTLWKYNMAEPQGSWKALATLKMPRANPCLLNTPSGLYALGGRSGEQAMSIVEYYDPHLDTWMPAHSMTKARCYFGAVEANGMLYAIDGMKDNVSIHKSTEMLDPRIGTWSFVEKKSTKGRTAFSCVHHRDAIYLLGGIVPYAESTLTHENSTQIFDLRMNAWRLGQPMHYRRAWSTAAVMDDVLFVIGGRSTIASNPTNAPIERLVNDQWTVEPEIDEVSGHRAFAAACVMVL